MELPLRNPLEGLHAGLAGGTRKKDLGEGTGTPPTEAGDERERMSAPKKGEGAGQPALIPSRRRRP